MGQVLRSSTRHSARLESGSTEPDLRQLATIQSSRARPAWWRASTSGLRFSAYGGVLANLLSDGRLSVITASGVLALLIVGVIYPAVWSRKPNRRQDAQAVIKLLFRRNDRPP